LHSALMRSMIFSWSWRSVGEVSLVVMDWI
jgi:hypothetical protein